MANCSHPRRQLSPVGLLGGLSGENACHTHSPLLGPDYPCTRRAVPMANASDQKDWTKPAALAIPKGGFFPDKVEQGRYGQIFPRTPACYGFSILAKIIAA